jgi:organic radical activating enzyme
MLTLPINETFVSIPGEGHYAGSLSFFIRTAGCDLECPFCDTNHLPTSKMFIGDLVQAAIDANIKHVVITGGEPTLHLPELKDLVRQLSLKRFNVQIETNGFMSLDPVEVDAWITLSPKTLQHDMRIGRCCEVKLLVDENGPINDLNIDTYDVYQHIHKYFQPVDPGIGGATPDVSYLVRVKPAVDKILSLMKVYPSWKLSLQQHKLYNWR